MTPKRRLSQVGEFGWLKKLLPRLFWPSSLHPQLCIGPGDDAGVLRITSGRVLVTTTDALVEGVHFERKWFSARDLGEKLLAVNLSDLAAMGRVKPLAALITAALPGDTPVDSVDMFYKGLRSSAQRWKIGLLGGDTVGSPKGWFVSATVFGEADPRGLVRRKGAKPGDLIAVIGPLGSAAAGLEVLQDGRKRWSWTRPLVKAFSQPLPQLAVGSVLGEHRWASSLLDASDGLETSVRLLAEASHLGVRLDLTHFAVPPALRRWATYKDKDPLEYVLRGGEDYALVFTVSPAHWTKLKRRLPSAQQIGQMVPPRQGSWARWNKHKIELKNYGYAHF